MRYIKLQAIVIKKEPIYISLIVMADSSSKYAPYYPDIKHFINIFLSENIRMNIITLDNKFKSNSPNVNVFYIKKFQNANTLLNHLFIQIYLSYVLYKIRRQNKYNFFHVGGTQCILPQITAKLLGQFNFTFILGSTEIGMKFDLSYSRFSLDKICRYIEFCLIELSEYITLTITNRLIFLSKSLKNFRFWEISLTHRKVFNSIRGIKLYL